MLSNMMVTKLLFQVVILFSPLSSSFRYGQSLGCMSERLDFGSNPPGSIKQIEGPAGVIFLAFIIAFCCLFLCCLPTKEDSVCCFYGGCICESFQVLRYCYQATINGFTAVFQTIIRGCFHSTVMFIQHCHLQKRERNQNQENSSFLSDTNFMGIDVEIGDQAGTVSQSADSMEVSVLGSAVNQQVDSVEVDDIGGTVNQTADGTIDGVATSASSDTERRVQYQTEAISNLNSLHSMLKHPPQMLRVRRSQIVTDVLRFFEDSSSGTQLISTRFIDEDGADGGGVTRDMLTVFWNEVKEWYFHGNEVFVPHLRPERLSKKNDFVTLGRIFSLSTATLRSIPIQICRSTLMVIIYDTCDVNPDILLNDFLLFLDNEDRELVKTSLNSFDNMGEIEKEKLQEFLMKFGMGIVPRAATLRQHMIDLAQNELCIKPKFFCENMRMGIPQRHMKHFWMQMTLDHLDHLYRDFLITAGNIWQKIRCERWPLQNPNERRVYGYLRYLIQDLAEETLLSFVQFVTADRKIPSSFITVGFNDTQGIARCPIARTCAYRLDIPVSYNSFEEFKREFVMILNSDEAKTFSKY